MQPWLSENPDIYQHHRIRPCNTFLVGVCICPEDEYHDLAVMLETHLPQLDELLMDGFWVHDVLWPVRLLLGSNYAAQCDDVGHERTSAMQPCIFCRRTRSPSCAQELLDAAYGTLPNAFVSRNLREATLFSNCMAADGGRPPVR